MRNARSPKLWNKVFEKLGALSRMGSIDLEFSSAIDFRNFVKEIPEVKGLAIAFPNKIYVEELLFPDKTESVGINVVRIEGDALSGMNFDGIGALESLLLNFQLSPEVLMNDFQVVIYGTGSTAHSFQKALVGIGFPIKSITLVASRESFHHGNAGNRIFNRPQDLNGSAKKIILVNATPLGSVSYPNSNPFDRKLIEQFKERLELVFDFNYGVTSSGPEKFAKENSVKYFDGRLMNLCQAAHSFKFATGSDFDIEVKQILNIMQEVE